MARNKVANTKFEIQEYTPGESYTEEGWLVLAKHITNADPNNNEETEDAAFLDGDGTPETDVVSAKGGYTFTGYRNDEDAAQNLIAEKQFQVGDNRKLWFKRTYPSGEGHVGVATATDITPDGGEASEYNTFEVSISWDRAPEKISGEMG